MSNFILLRSPESLTYSDWAGYGWRKVDFSKFNTLPELLTALKEKYASLGRKRNQITRFFNIKAEDVIVVPISKHIVLGYATGIKHYEEGVGYGENRVKVSFLRDQEGNLIKVRRNQLSQAFSSRLKIRMAICPLTEFSDEISVLLEQIKNDGGVSFNSKFFESEERAINDFKKQLLSNIKQGKTNLESGGYGLEKLVLELLQIEGYKGKILAKNQSGNIADADIEASRSDTFTSTRLIIQVKHHKGLTGEHGLNQLIMFDEEDADKWLITSGNLSEKLMKTASSKGIFVMDGGGLVDWLFEHLSQLSPITKSKLHISDVPLISSP